MEFERSIFRMHERILISNKCPIFVKYVQRISCCLFIYFLIGFILYHRMYAGQSDLLQKAIEDQILSRASTPEYQKLSYSQKTDKFIFCNKVSYSRNDTESLIKEAVKSTN